MALLPPPLVIAAFAFAAGGLGNVAFVMHNGNTIGLAVVRFALAIPVALTVFALKSFRERSRSTPRVAAPVPWRWVTACAAFEVGGVVLLMEAAARSPAMVITVISMCSIPLLIMGGRLMGLQRGNMGSAVAALVAATAGTLLALAQGDGGGFQLTWGMLFAAGSMLCVVGSALTSGKVAGRVSVWVIVLTMGVVGVGALSAIAVVIGMDVIRLTVSTVMVGAFIAVVPGGLGKAAVLWANARSAPYLVQSLGSVAVVTAGIGGWVLLGQAPTANQLVLASVVVVAILMMLGLSARHGVRNEMGDH